MLTDHEDKPICPRCGADSKWATDLPPWHGEGKYPDYCDKCEEKLESSADEAELVKLLLC